jgi:hypothetical protein
VTRPKTLVGGAVIGPANYDVLRISGCHGCEGVRYYWDDPFTNNNASTIASSDWMNGSSNGFFGIFGSGCAERDINVNVGASATDECDNNWLDSCKCNRSVELVREVRDPDCKETKTLSTFAGSTSAQYRQVFNSPETSFGQPFLGEILKLENVMYGAGLAHFVQVKNNANYKLLSKEAQVAALNSSFAITDSGESSCSKSLNID